MNDGTARIAELEAAIRRHRDERSDDRCWRDDDRLYEVLGDGIKCDRRVGDKAEMLKNCERFIENRCESGGWRTYAELEAELIQLRTLVAQYLTNPKYGLCVAVHWKNLPLHVEPTRPQAVFVVDGPGADDVEMEGWYEYTGDLDKPGPRTVTYRVRRIEGWCGPAVQKWSGSGPRIGSRRYPEKDCERAASGDPLWVGLLRLMFPHLLFIPPLPLKIEALPGGIDRGRQVDG
jgi:hypothetical protein